MSFFPSFQNTGRESCEKAIRAGSIAAVVSGFVTAAFGVAGFFVSRESGPLSQVLDPWVLLDATFLFVLAWFIGARKSRTAASILVAYFVWSKLVMWIDAGSVSGLPLAIVFFLYYWNAARATFQFHRTAALA